MKKLELPDMKKEWDDIFKIMDKKELKLSEKEIQKAKAPERKKSDTGLSFVGFKNFLGFADNNLCEVT